MRGAEEKKGTILISLLYYPLSPQPTTPKQEMNTLKAIIQTSLPLPNSPIPTIRTKRQSTLCFCTSDGSSKSDDSSGEGDKRKQDLLARIAMLQTQKVRLTDYLDERAAYMTQFTEDANADFDKLGEDALKELDEASARILENMENRMQAFEETAEINKQEIKESEKVLEEFEEKVDNDRNEGLFFKSMSEKAPSQKKKEASNVEAQNVQETIKESAGSKTRRGIYLVLISLLAVGIGNVVLASPEVEWRKVAALGLILIGFIAQLIYEQNLLSGVEKQDKGEE